MAFLGDIILVIVGLVASVAWLIAVCAWVAGWGDGPTQYRAWTRWAEDYLYEGD